MSTLHLVGKIAPDGARRVEDVLGRQLTRMSGHARPLAQHTSWLLLDDFAASFNNLGASLMDKLPRETGSMFHENVARVHDRICRLCA